jgi:uncharacterized membrane protein affecting hemolysin expression
MNLDFYSLALIVGGILTCVVILLGVARFSRFYVDFKRMHREMTSELNNISTILKKINSANLENLFEQRQNNKAMAAFLQKFADIEVEVVEEPIPQEEQGKE